MMDFPRIKIIVFLTSILTGFVESEILPSEKVDEPIPLTELTVVAGFTANLPCNLSSDTKNDQAAMVFWYKTENEGSPIYSLDGRSRPLSQGKQWSNLNVFGDRAKMRVMTSHVELQIDRLMPEDAGTYKCRVDFRNNPTKNQKINLRILVPPQSPVIFTKDRILAKNLHSYNEDGELILICEVSGGSPPPIVTWYRDGKLCDDTFEYRHETDVTVNRLNVTRVTRDLLRAQFICNASNTNLIPPKIAEIIFDLNLKPLVVNITNKSHHLSALRTYEIECISSGSRPEAVITWWKGSHQVKHMARNFAEGPNMTRSVMSYVPTIEDDKKFLMCRAENPVLEGALEDMWKLNIHYVPVVTMKLGSSLRASDINEGDDVYFECDVKANPKAYKLAWYKGGKELHHNASAGIILPGGHSLVLQSVTRNSAGEYSCMAANHEGKATSRPVTLDVMYSPVCKDGTTTQIVGALKHETISLACSVQSRPPPTTFQWTFNNSGELMNVPSTRYTQAHPQQQHLITSHWHGSRLNYTITGDMDYGTIACLASNAIGLQKVPCLFQIIVAGKPYPLQNCTAIQSTGPYAYRSGMDNGRDIDWLIVRCNEGFDGGLPITSFELEVYSDESVYHVNTIYINHTDKITATFGPIFEVPGLEPGRNYKLLLYSVNAKGRSDPVVLEPVTIKGVAMYTTGRDSKDISTDYSLLVACFAGGVTAVCILVVGVTLTLYRRNHRPQATKTQTHLVQFADGEAYSNLTVNSQEERHFNHEQTQRRRTQQRHVQYLDQEHELQLRLCETLRDSLEEFRVAKGSKEQILAESTEEDPDVIPNKVRPDIFQANYSGSKILTESVVKNYNNERYSQVSNRDDDDFEICPSRGVSLPSNLLINDASNEVWVNSNSEVMRNGHVVQNSIKVVSPTRPNTLPVNRNQHVYTKSLKVQESCI